MRRASWLLWLPLLRRQLSSNRPDRMAPFGQGLGELLRQVVGGWPEAAEDHRPIAIGQQCLHLADQLLELWVLGWALERLRSLDQIFEPAGILSQG